MAAVDENGLVTAVRAGSATITIATVDGGKTAQCRITVRASISVTDVWLNRSSASVKVGQRGKLYANVLPYRATDNDVVWSSSDMSVVAVDAYGNYSAKNAGTATITVTTADGGYTATCTVTVGGKSNNSHGW